MTGTLTFDNIKLYGFHGLHAEESLIGTDFTIHIKARLSADFLKENPTLQNSVNYELLYQVLNETFSRREDLIETVALNIFKAMKSNFDQVGHWTIKIEKKNPLGAGNFNPVFEVEG